jgi:hypothetical protein
MREGFGAVKTPSRASREKRREETPCFSHFGGALVVLATGPNGRSFSVLRDASEEMRPGREAEAPESDLNDAGWPRPKGRQLRAR